MAAQGDTAGLGWMRTGGAGIHACELQAPNPKALAAALLRRSNTSWTEALSLETLNIAELKLCYWIPGDKSSPPRGTQNRSSPLAFHAGADSGRVM
jgi:hypothetical protein